MNLGRKGAVHDSFRGFLGPLRLQRIDHYWQSRNLVSLALVPLSWLFCLIAWLRRLAYRNGLLRQQRLAVPVIVIGNISVGGTGKTPLIVWLARYLMRKGYSPGIITRGYGGAAESWPQAVEPDTPAVEVGDEAVLLRRRTGCPLFAGPERVEAGRALLAQHDCDLLLSDDGLQHYALARDLEIVVVDGVRRFGNGWCLPAGPLRERPARLQSVDLVVSNGALLSGASQIRVSGSSAINLSGSRRERPLESFRGEPIAAVAGIGNPERFFQTLESRGLEISRHPFADHYSFSREDFCDFEGQTVLMTEKDAVKCESFAGDTFWYVPADTEVDASLQRRIDALIDRLFDGQKTA
ncbi:tetraacyldisaccharide 4'-kinase [endosymbiont of Ridgeia piscesae]|jgi:tetraacyldisaccharide 4'-kinase|uniref:Tetraacyldisaccharide 4'-kinase n=1 Tax=endosymbiont of Ridgeia piscesae TaxID=54398 RepID=A0A0T5YZ79_9GAMM|nr:tetraacyldisaccharide 4'-kinase [endosymbiont of Ridgeia piscesae]KRT55930.1 lipid-A-disaccharide kinase [endosymbiont of Ridgeia piscesae]KRT59915.1 lipid-A-disaccharide kinase [endosymbiont of Ridgeia piscesae]